MLSTRSSILLLAAALFVATASAAHSLPLSGNHSLQDTSSASSSIFVLSHAPNINIPRAPQGKPSYVEHPAADLVCKPFGECSPCPEDDLDQPFCMPFGNRRLLHCIPASAQDDPNPPGAVPAWESCGKVVNKEARDFYEFVTANVLLLVVCLVIFAVRTSALAAQQYRQLAARIGIPSGGWQV